MVNKDTWTCGQPYQHVPVEKDPSMSLEAKSKKMLDNYDKEKLANWKEGINYLLVIGALLATVAAAFAVESTNDLEEDPQVTTALFLGRLIQQLNGTFPETTLEPFESSASADDRTVNILYFLSMTFSLTAVTLGLLTLQCIAEYSRGVSHLSFQQYLVVRRLREQSFDAYHIESLVDALPIILQLSLFTFFAAVVVQLFGDDYVVAIPILIAAAIPFVVVVGTRLLPAYNPLPESSTEPKWPAPYRSFMSWWLLKGILHLFSKSNILVAELKKAKNWVAYDRAWMENAQNASRQYLAPLLEVYNGGIEEAVAVYSAFYEEDSATAYSSLIAAQASQPDDSALSTLTHGSTGNNHFDRDSILWETIQFLQRRSTAVVTDKRFAAHKVELFLRLGNLAQTDKTLSPAFDALFPLFPDVGPFSHPLTESMRPDHLKLYFLAPEISLNLLEYITIREVLKKLFDEYQITGLRSKRQGLHAIWEITLSILVSGEKDVDQKRHIQKLFKAICPFLRDNTSGPNAQLGQPQANKLVHSANTVFSPILSDFKHTMKENLTGDGCFRHCMYEMANALRTGNNQDATSSTVQWVDEQMQQARSGTSWERPESCGGVRRR